MVDAEVQTEPTLPATVVGVEQDLLIGVRIRKNFGVRVFWGSIVGCYWVSGGLFYKVSFDDGDVDIFSADEVVQDAQAAKTHAKENPQKEKPTDTAVDEYFTAMRHHNLKRKRDDVVDNTLPNVRRVSLWGQRLYASIYTNEKNETFIKELLKTDDGQIGEMEATGQVKVGDMILAVNQTRVLGIPSRDLAELIRKPKRPIVLTFYRPQNSQMPAQQQTQTQETQVQTSSATSTAQTQSVTPAQAATVPRQQVATVPASVMPSFVLPQVFAHPPQIVQRLAQQWTQQATNKEIIRQRVYQNAAARQNSYVPGYPMGVFVPGNAVPVSAVPSAHSGAYQTQQVRGTAPMRVTSGFAVPTAQPSRPMYQPLSAATSTQFERNQRQRTTPTHYQQVQQVQTQRNVVPAPSRNSTERTRPLSSSTAANARSSGAQESRISILSLEDPQQRTTSEQPRSTQQDSSSTSRQPPNPVSTQDQSSADNTTRESPRERTSTSAVMATASTTQKSTLTTQDAAAIARLAETNPKAAASMMRDGMPTTSLLSPNEAPTDTEMEDTSQSTSFLSPGAPVDQDPKATKRATEGAMSFLSPNDFTAELSTPSRELSTGHAVSKPAEVRSNVSLVTVKVSRHRLYLTLGVQGTLIAVTSFVLDEFGRPGEVEQSGKVFLGDVLVRINDNYITPGMTPSHVAAIVNSAARPMTLWFERASWDVLDGKA